MASSGNYVSSLNYVTGVLFTNNLHGSLTLRASATTGAITSTQAVNCTLTNATLVGGRAIFYAAQGCTINTPIYYDHTITTTTTSTNPTSVIEFATGANGNTVDGMSLPLPANGAYTALVTLTASYNTIIKNMGTDSVTTLVMNASVTGVAVNGTGNNDGITMKRVYVTNTRSGVYSFLNSDTNILVQNSRGDYADTTVMAGLNASYQGVGMTSASTGQTAVYGTHWGSRFTSTTGGFLDLLCNEPTAASAAQCSATGGTPQFNSSGSVLLTKIGDQVTWEMGFYAIGFTAFTNSLTTATGTNVTWTSGSTWGNHTIEFQVNTGGGYGAWTALNATNLNAATFNSTTGFRLKVRATCLTANAGNVLTRLAIPLTTTSSDQQTKLYPLSTNTLTITGLVSGSDVVINTSGTSTTVGEVDAGGTSFAWVFSGAQTVDVKIMKAGYSPLQIYGLALTATDTTLPVAQVIDRTYV